MKLPQVVKGVSSSWGSRACEALVNGERLWVGGLGFKAISFSSSRSVLSV